MTDQQRIAEIRAQCEKATPGPWGSRIDIGKKYYIFTLDYGVRDFCCLSGGFEHEADAAFIARSRTLIPELCDALENAEKQLQEQCDKMGAWLEEYNEMKIALRESQRWIPVSERLPEEGQRVLVWNCAISPSHVATFTSGGRPENMWHYNDGYDDPACWVDGVTHWMPLPAAPEKGE